MLFSKSAISLALAFKVILTLVIVTNVASAPENSEEVHSDTMCHPHV